MRINPSDRKIALIIKAMNDLIIPELESETAQAVAGMINSTLADLLKRETVSSHMLSQCIADGCELANEFAIALNATVDLSAITESTVTHFDGLVEQHALLTEQLAALSELLIRSDLSAPVKEGLLHKGATWELSYYTRQTALDVPDLSSNHGQGVPLTQELLESFLQQDSSDPNITVSEFKPLTGGFGKQTYMSVYTTADGESHDVVVRKTDPTPIMKHAACDLRNEYDLLKALAKTDYPAPKPLSFCENFAGIDGDFYTMDRIPGSPPGSYLGGMSGDVDEQLFLELAELLGKLHSTPIELFSDYIHKYEDPIILTGTTEECYRHILRGWADYMQREPHLHSPYMFWLLEWLNNNVPADTRPPILIHGDFNIHNVLAQGNHVTAVLDWECAGFGCPEQDLAYIKTHISQHIDWDKFVKHYQAHGGKALNPASMGFGFVYSALRTNLAGNRATHNLQSGLNQDIRYAMVEQGFTASFMGMALQASEQK